VSRKLKSEKRIKWLTSSFWSNIGPISCGHNNTCVFKSISSFGNKCMSNKNAMDFFKSRIWLPKLTIVVLLALFIKLTIWFISSVVSGFFNALALIFSNSSHTLCFYTTRLIIRIKFKSKWLIFKFTYCIRFDDYRWERLVSAWYDRELFESLHFWDHRTSNKSCRIQLHSIPIGYL
jgi:hypothetical protein